MTSASVIARAALIGLAAGSRASLGVGAPVLISGSTPRRPSRGSAGRPLRLFALTNVALDLVMDKRPSTPARTSPDQLVICLIAAAGGGSTLARRDGAGVVVPVVVSVAGAALGAYAGIAWRRWSAARRPDWHGAVAEDAVALVLAVAASRPPGQA